MAPALAYVRVSTHGQVESGLSLEHQQRAVETYCAERELRLEKVYREEGVSAGTPFARRPQGGAILAELKARPKGCHVVIPRLDRAFRNMTDAAATMGSLERAGHYLHVLDPRLCTYGQGGLEGIATRMLLLVMAGAAEMERQLIRERNREAAAALRARGKPAGHPPLGFAVDRWGDLQPCEAELVALGRLYDLEVGEPGRPGLTHAQVAAQLNAEGLTPRRAGAWKVPNLRTQWKRLQEDGELRRRACAAWLEYRRGLA